MTPLSRSARRLLRALRASRSSRRRFIDSAPSPQTAVDSVPIGWATRFPEPLDDVRAGEVDLFTYERMTWGFERLGGLAGRSVLELGPLEGAHSYMAQQAGAKRIVSVESNRQAFLKCLVVKELFDLDRCSFLCGDAIEYLVEASEQFDICFACGILYHSPEPVRMIDLISQRASRLLIWTHYYEEGAVANAGITNRFAPVEEVDYGGFRHRVHRHSYGLATRLTGFWGGNQPYSNWLPRDDLLGALQHFGWRDIEIAFEDDRHPNGPALALVAVRG